MKGLWLIGVLTVSNFVLLSLLLAQGRPAAARGALPVLRGSGLQIVDAQGKVRASIDVYPGNSKTNYPDTVILRLTDTNGKPHVKLLTTKGGATLGLIGAAEAADARIGAQGTDALLQVTKGGNKW